MFAAVWERQQGGAFGPREMRRRVSTVDLVSARAPPLCRLRCRAPAVNSQSFLPLPPAAAAANAAV